MVEFRITLNLRMPPPKGGKRRRQKRKTWRRSHEGAHLVVCNKVPFIFNNNNTTKGLQQGERIKKGVKKG
jgi:hypothetical protein